MKSSTRRIHNAAEFKVSLGLVLYDYYFLLLIRDSHKGNKPKDAFCSFYDKVNPLALHFMEMDLRLYVGSKWKRTVFWNFIFSGPKINFRFCSSCVEKKSFFSSFSPVLSPLTDTIVSLWSLWAWTIDVNLPPFGSRLNPPSASAGQSQMFAQLWEQSRGILLQSLRPVASSPHTLPPDMIDSSA